MTTVPVQRRPGVPREMVRLIEGRYTLYGVASSPRAPSREWRATFWGPRRRILGAVTELPAVRRPLATPSSAWRASRRQAVAP